MDNNQLPAEESLAHPPVEPNRGLRKWLWLPVVAILLLSAGGYAAVALTGKKTAKTAATPSPQPAVTSTEQTQIGSGPQATTVLNVTEVVAQDANVASLLATALQVANDATVQGNLTVNGSGVFGGTLSAANFIGSGAGLSGVDAVLLNGQPGAYYAGLASNVGALTVNAALRNAPNTFVDANNFTAGLSSASITDAGALTVAGPINLGGTTTISNLSLSAPLTVDNGGTGLAAVPAASVLYGQGGPTLGVATPGAAGLCLLSGVSDVQWASCSGASAGVTTLDNLGGVLTLNNSTGAGAAITIDNATTGAKGIASFNAGNFSVVAGAVNTVQNISTASSPTFAAINTNAITPSGALTVGATGQTLTLQGSNTTLTATNGANVAQLTFVAPTANVTYRLQTAAAGTYDVCTTAGNCVGVGGSVSTSGGVANTIPKYTSASAIGPSLLTDNGALVTVGGNLSVTGTVTLTSALTVGNGGTGSTSAGGARTNLGAAASGANADITQLSALSTAITVLQGGTGATSLTANGVLLGNGTGPVSSLSTATPNLCLESTAGAPVWAACTGGGAGGVTTLDSQSGVVTIANSSGSGGVVTIQDASTTQKGLAQFNSTNFSGSGTINTIQDIATTSAPTFGQLTLTSSQATNPMLLVNNTNVGGTGNLLDVQTNGTSRLTVANGGDVTVGSNLLVGNPGVVGKVTIQGIASQVGLVVKGQSGQSVNLFEVVDSANNVNASIGSSGSVLNLGRIASSGTVTAGSIVLADGTTDNFGATINTTTLTAGRTLTIPDVSGTICTTAGNCLGGGSGGANTALSNLGSVAINTSLLPGSAAGADLGSSALPFGKLFVAGTSGTPGTNNFQFTGVATAARTITIPDATGTICLSTGNCAGAGGGVTTAGGTTNQIAKFTASGAIGDSSISDNGTNVTLATNVNLVLQGANATITNTQGQTDSEAFGAGASVGGAGSVAFGQGASTQDDGTAVGQGTVAYTGSVAIGNGANGGAGLTYGTSVGASTVSGDFGTALGAFANAGNDGIALGAGAQAGSNQLVVGGNTASGLYIQDAYIGSGVTDTSPTSAILHATGGSGSNVAGADFTLAGGIGTGTGNGGNLNFQTAAPGTTGSTPNSLATVASLSGINGAALFQNSANSTAAFQIQNEGSASLFSADTTDGEIVVGIGAANVVGATLTVGAAAGGGYAEAFNGASNAGIYVDAAHVALGTISNVPLDLFTNNQGTAAERLNTNGSATFKNYTNTTTAFQVQNAAGNQLLAVDTTGSQVVLGTPSTLTGQLTFANSANANTVSLATASQANNVALTIPADTNTTDTVCLQTLANCGGGGGGISGSGTTNKIAKFTSSGAIGDSSISDSGTSITVKPSSDSTTAFQIQNAAGTTSLLTADTTNNNIDLGVDTNLILSGSTAYISNPQGHVNSEAFGAGATVTNDRATAVGANASATSDGVAIGYNAVSSNSAGVAIGSGANSTNSGGTAVGESSAADFNGTALGYQSYAQTEGVAIGVGANFGVVTNIHNSVAIGDGATNTTTNQLVIGGSDADGTFIQDAYIGSGVTDTSPQTIALHATGGSGANVAGANFDLAGGIGTGDATGGNINFGIAAPGTSGSSPNTIATVASLNGANGAALFQNATNSTTAFQVQNATGLSMLNVDTTNSAISLGTSSTTTFGNTLNATTGSDGGGTWGSYWDGTSKQMLMAQQFTTASGGALSSMSTYVGRGGISGTNKLYQMAIYSDNSGQPGTYVASTAVGTLNASAAWNTLPINATLSPDTKYWLTYWTNVNDNGDNSQDYTASLRGTTNVTMYNTYENWQCTSGCGTTVNGMPNTYPTGGASVEQANMISIYATFANSAPALQIDSSGNTIQSGDALLQAQTNSTSAFQVNGADNQPILQVDTTDQSVGINAAPGEGFNLVVAAGGQGNGGGEIVQGISYNLLQADGEDGEDLMDINSIDSKVSVVDTTIGDSVNNLNGAGLLFSDNFESGNFGLWSGGSSGSASIDSSQNHDGRYSAEVNTTSSTGYARTSFSSTSDTLTLNTWVRWDTLPGSGELPLLTLYQSSTPTNKVEVYIAPDWHLGVINGATDLGTGGGNAYLQNDTWVPIALTINRTTGEITIDGSSNGPIYDPANDYTGLTIGSGWDTLQIGNSTSNTGDTWYDDVNLSTGIVPAMSNGLTVQDSLHTGGSATFGGQVLVQPGSDSTDAFQVQDTGGTSLLTVDTLTPSVSIGAVGSSGLASTVHIADSSNATQTVTVGGSGFSSATTIQGGEGGIALGTGPWSGTTGSISIATGDSSGGASGDITIDNGSNVPTGTPATNTPKTFESGLDNMTDFFGFTDTLSSSTTQAHSGTHSLKIVAGASGGWSINDAAPYVISGITPGHSYTFGAWIRAGTTAGTDTFTTDFSSNGFGGGGSVGTYQWGSGTDNSSGWTQVTGTLVAPAGAAYLAIYVTGTSAAIGEVHYIDDITVVDTTSTVAPAINIGTSNAQSINIGNSNQTAATTLQGGAGGVDIASGLGAAINIGTAATNNVNIGTNSGATGTTIKGGSSGINLITNQTGTGTLVQSATNSTTAFQIQNAAGATLVDEDSTIDQLSVSGYVGVVGLQPPTSAPTVAVNPTTGNLNGTYYYVVTYANAANGETQYGPVSSAVSPASQQVNLTNIPISPSGLVTDRVIYRTLAGGSSAGPFYLDGDVPGDTTTTFTDNAPDASISSGPQASLSNNTSNISNPEGYTQSEAFGDGATVQGNFATALGNSTTAFYQGTAVGYAATVDNYAGVAVGNGALATQNAIAVGSGSSADQYGGVALGADTTITNFDGVAIGNGASAAADSVAIGYSTNASFDNDFVVGASATTTNDHQAVLGGPTAGTGYIQDAYIGSGVTDISPTSAILHATGGSGSNVAGASFTLAGGIGTGTGTGGNLNFQTAAPGTTGSTPNTLATVASLSGVNGAALFQNSANSSTAFQVQNAGGNSALSVGTVTNDLVTNGSLEAGTAGWAAKGGASISNNGTGLYGAHSLDTLTGTAAGDGAKYPITLTSGHLYSLSFYGQLHAINGSTTAGQNWSSLNYGYAQDGATEDVAGISSTSNTMQTTTNGSWYHFTLNFTPSSISGTPYLYFKQATSPTTSREFYIDGVQLTDTTGFGSATSIAPYTEGTVSLAAPISSPLVVSAGDVAGALEVLNSADGAVFNVDTRLGIVGIGTGSPASKLQVQSGATGTQSTYSVIRANATTLDSSDGGSGSLNLLDLDNTTASAFTGSGEALTVTNAGNFTAQGYTPVAGAGAGANAGTTFSVIGSTGQAGAAGTFTGGSGGVISLVGGTGGAATGTAVNSNGGNIILQGGAAGTGGSGTAGTNGGVSIPFVTGGSSTAFQVLTNSSQLLTADTTNTRVTIGTTGACAGPANGRLCINQNASTLNTNTINQNNTVTITGGTGGTSYSSYFNVADTNNGVVNTDNLLYLDATGTTNTSATVNSFTSKVTASQLGNFLQFSNGATTELAFSNAGVMTIQGGAAKDITSASTNALTIDTGGAAALNLGTASATTITVGNSASTTQTINIGSVGSTATTSTVNIATTHDTTHAQQVTIGSAFEGADFTNIIGGSSGGVSLTTGNNGTAHINDTTNTGTIVDIGSVTNDVTSTVNISSKTGGSAVKNVNIGSTDSTSATTIQGGTGNINLLTNQAGAGTTVKTVTTNSTTAFLVQDSGSATALVVSTNNVTGSGNAANATLKVAEDSGTSRSINAAGSINASGADYAEYFKQATPDALTAGDIVCLTPGGQAEACNSSSSDQLVGAVSTHPGYVGNDIYDPAHPGNTALVGLLGQIEVNVSAANGAINPGDMLTISPTTGVAEKATTPGTALGSALEGFSGPGTGLINVYVHVGYYAPPVSDTLQPNGTPVQDGGDANLANLNVSGTATLAALTVTGDATVTGRLTVGSLHVTADLLVDGHIVSGGGVPTITAAAGCSSTVAVSGTDTAGLVTITGGAGCAAGKLATVTFSNAFAAAPRVTLTPADPAAATAQSYVDSSTITPAGFDIGTVTAPTLAKTYKWYYQVIQ